VLSWKLHKIGFIFELKNDFHSSGTLGFGQYKFEKISMAFKILVSPSPEKPEII
jgi:hypothetical protein